MLSVVIHGHFYQPPREDPFLDELESEPSAAPFHDWNQRIERECYRAVVAARISRDDGRIERLVNTLEWISFNVGPTLLEWMEREAKPTYESIIAADHASAERLGGLGNAIAQPYHHTILPLATRRDKQTEVRWGIADFRRRFGREPAGMWLPETAVDTETLEVLARRGSGSRSSRRTRCSNGLHAAGRGSSGSPAGHRSRSSSTMASCRIAWPSVAPCTTGLPGRASWLTPAQRCRASRPRPCRSRRRNGMPAASRRRRRAPSLPRRPSRTR